MYYKKNHAVYPWATWSNTFTKMIIVRYELPSSSCKTWSFKQDVKKPKNNLLFMHLLKYTHKSK